MIDTWQNRIVRHGEAPPAELNAHPLNWRNHPRSQREAMESVLARVGWVDQVLVNVRTGWIVNGHLRVELARERGEALVPVTYVDLSEEEERLILATFDPIGAMATADQRNLQTLLAELGPVDEALETLLESLGPPSQPLVLTGDPEDIPDLAEDPCSQRGDRWQLGEQRIMCGDSSASDDVHALLEGERASWMWTDPPYGNEYVGRTRRRLELDGNDADGLDTLLKRSFALAGEVLADRSPIYVAHPAGPQSAVFINAFLTAGWHLHQTLVWVKDSAVLGHSDHQYRHEPVLYGWRGRRARWHGGRKVTSVFEIPRPRRSDEHPTVKPLELVETHLQHSTVRGELGYEPFAGSGTTLVAAHRLGRRCYGMETNAAYVDLVLRRWEACTGGQAILLGDGRSFAEVKEARQEIPVATNA